MVGIKVYGGLGNQMFQYVFYLYQKKYNNDVYLDISDFKVHKHHYGFELDKTFSNIKYDVIEGKKLNKLRVNPNTLLRRFINKFMNIKLVYENEIRELPARMIIEPYNYNTDIYFNGFWANRKYIDEMKETVQKAFKFKYVPEGKNLKLLKKIEDSTSVSVHVRRGDFLKDEKIANCCSLDYYRNAFNYFLNMDSNSCFVIFSDDIEWVKHNLQFASNMVFVDWNTGEYSSRDMQMMSFCKHHIIANSTFSWWGAWLGGGGTNTDKCVIAPKVWSTDYINGNPLIYEDWILL